MKFQHLVSIYIIGALTTILAMVLACPPLWDQFWYGRELAIGNKAPGLLVPVMFGGGVLAWSAGYALMLREISLGRMSDIEVRRFYIVTLVLMGLMVLLPPVLSRDVFLYYQHGWVASVKGANPYLTTAASFTGTPGMNLTEFIHSNLSTPYSPLWTHVATLIVTLSGGSLWVGTLLFKLTTVGAMVACTFLARRVLKEINPSLSSLGFMFIAANPLIMVESASTGHNDIVAIAAVMLGVWLMLRDPLKPWWGLLAICTGILLKASAAPALMIAGLWICRDIWKKKLSWFVIPLSALLVIMLLAVVIMPFWSGFTDLPRLFGLGMMTGGPYKMWLAPALLAKEGMYYITQLMGTGMAREIVDAGVSGFLAAFTLFCTLFFGLRSDHRKIRISGLAPVYVLGTILQVYWRQCYVLWPAVFKSLAPKGIWLRLIWCYSIVALLSYLVTHSSHVYCCY